MAPETAKKIGPYELLSVVGTGTRGPVYKARRGDSGELVALKVFSLHSQRSQSLTSGIDREVGIIGRLSHPNIARLIEKGMDGDRAYIVTEFIDGTSLSGRLAAERLTLAAAIHVVRRVAKALIYAHRQGVIHGNLNPASILVARDLSAVKLKDFAEPRGRLISLEDGTVTAALADIRTLPYWAPESRGSAAFDERGDIYSLGVICYEALTGTVPSGRFSLPSELNRQLPLALDPIVLKCLAADPDQRYVSVEAFLRNLDKVEQVEDYQLISELKRLSGGRLFSGGPSDTAARPGEARIRLLIVTAMIVLLVGIAAGVGFLWLRGSPSEPESRSVAPSAGPEVPSASAPAVPTGSPASMTPGNSAAIPAPSTLIPVQKATGTTTSPAPKTVAQLPGAKAPISASPDLLPSPTAASRGIERLNEEAARALKAVRGQVEAGQAHAAEADLRTFLGKYAGTPSGADGYLLLALVQEREGYLRAAIDTYQEIARRYRGDPRAATALFNEGKLLDKTRAGDAEVRKRLAVIGEEYHHTPVFVPAMTTKMAIEDRLRLKEVDPTTGATVSASMLTRRRLIDCAPQDPAAESALAQLGAMYEEIKQYRQSAVAYTEFATRFPNSKLDAWYKAGDLYERRLKSPAEAVAAYLKVPPTSPRYKDARDRARRLSGR